MSFHAIKGAEARRQKHQSWPPTMASPAMLLICAIFLLQEALSATSSVVVVGTVFCDACLQHKFSETTSYFIPGASVAVECGISRKTSGSISVKGKTDEYGEFRLEMPSASHSLERCSVKMLSSPEDSCNIPSIPSNLKRSMNLEGDGTSNAGWFSYRPLKAPATCYSHLRLRGRAALEGASPNAPPLGLNFPQFPFPGGLPQIPPFPFTFQSPPPAQGDDASTANAESPVAAPAIAPSSPRLPALTFPLIPFIPFPLARPPPFPFLFPPIPFLTPSPPPSTTERQTP